MPSAVDWSTKNIIDLTGDAQRESVSKESAEISIRDDRNDARKITEPLIDLTRFDTSIASIRPIRTRETIISGSSARKYDNGNDRNAFKTRILSPRVESITSFPRAQLEAERSTYDHIGTCDRNAYEYPIKRRRNCEPNVNQPNLGPVGYRSHNRPQSSIPIEGNSNLVLPGAADPFTSSGSEHGHTTRKRKRRLISSRKLFTRENDKLLRHLKEVESLSWEQIANHFPGRTWHSLQSRYSKVLRPKFPESGYDNVLPGSVSLALDGDENLNDIRLHQEQVPASNIRGSEKDSSDDDTICSGSSRDCDRMPSTLKTLLIERNAAALAIPTDRILTKSGISYLSRPYLDHVERTFLHNGFGNGRWSKHRLKGWEHQILHVDFSWTELSEIIRCTNMISSAHNSCEGNPLAVLRSIVDRFSHDQILKLARLSAKCERLAARTTTGIETFLQDTRKGNISKRPSFLSFDSLATLSRYPRGQRRLLNSLLRQRELTSSIDFSTHRSFGVANAIKARVYTTYGPSKSFTGTSGDVGSVSWAPDGNVFAAGSVCLVDEDNMQYNRPYNLLLGDSDQGILKELPDHCIERRRAKSGVNSNDAMHRSQDSRLFMTVPAVSFSLDGSQLYSAGYDKTLKIWDLQSGIESAICTDTVTHDAPIDVLAVQSDGVVATGCRRYEKGAVSVMRFTESHVLDSMVTFSSNKSNERPEANIYPSCLRWGVNPAPNNYLLAGFASNGEDGAKDLLGEICLFDCVKEEQISISPCSGNVFDCAWNPNRTQAPLFAVACVAGKHVNRGTRSVVRLYDYRSSRYSLTMELECKAADINDVVYNPYDDNMICTGCTDGNVYVWDVRNPDHELTRLSHGMPLMPLDSSIPREFTDTGVRFCSWGGERNHLFTGSSDGKLKLWDLYQFSDDVFIQNSLQLDSGIMTGEFSRDYSKLLLGEVNGTVNIIEVGCGDKSLVDVDRIRLIQAAESRYGRCKVTSGDVNEESGLLESRKLLHEGVMQIRPMGAYKVRQAVQGPNYADAGGPIDRTPNSEALRNEAHKFQALLKQQQTVQPCQLPGCGDTRGKLTLEEIGDSGRSRDRIPYELTVPVMTKQEGHICQCKECGKPAQARVGFEEITCETCNFACFRCGNTARIRLLEELVECDICNCRWRPEILGYTLLSTGDVVKTATSTISQGCGTDNGNNTEGMNIGEEAITYYQSLWSDQPHSPA